jgi:hypothetical protein
MLWNISDDHTIKGCKVEKCRNGECGKEVMTFDGAHMTFKETEMTIKEAAEQAKLMGECPFDQGDPTFK